MNTNHATYDTTTGTISVTLETIYRDLAEWHLDEEVDAEEALDYARRFLLRLFGLTATTRGDTAATFAEQFLTRLPHGTRHAIHRVEADLAVMHEELHGTDDDSLDVICDACGEPIADGDDAGISGHIHAACADEADDLDAEREWTLNTHPRFDAVSYPTTDQQ